MTPDPRAWTAATAGPPPSWRLPPTADPAAVRAALDRRGFVVMRQPELPDRAARVAAYHEFATCLGRRVPQNVDGALLYDVRDTGVSVATGARFSVTNAESSFHTDGSFADAVPDVVGLLCLAGAKAGGVNQVVSGYAVHDRLDAATRAELARPFHVDRRGGVRPGEAPTARNPVLSEDADGLVIRYLRYWIEAGHAKADEPLTATQTAALDAFDRTAADPALRAEFVLDPGDVLYVANRWVLHNRTAFEDHPEPERRRHLVRLWLATDR
ncbi:TauD/TfdA family dioxygenase [bacterium]|nr:TauD/TfdA family dioxygenase [bacterium]